MKKYITILLTAVLILTALFLPFSAFAQDETSAPPVTGEEAQAEAPEEVPSETEPVPVPFITKIEFNGASFPTEFQQDVFEYTINVSSHDDFSLKSYSCTDYNAEMKIDYISSANGSTKGVIITVKNASGANDYKFYFDTVQTLPKTSDTSLIGINFNYGELYPSFRTDVYKYTLYLPMDLEVLVIDPITSDENATINTPSQISLKKDQNTPISIKVTSSDGTSTGSYKLTIKRVDKTIADIQQMMESPDFKTFVEIPFYKQATFYIIIAGVIFAIMLIAVVALSLKKGKKEPSETDIQIIVPPGSTVVPPTVLGTNDIPEKVILENNANDLEQNTSEEITGTDDVEVDSAPDVTKKETKKSKKEAKRLAKIEAQEKAKAESDAKALEEKKKLDEAEKAKKEAEEKAKAEAEADAKEKARIEAEEREKLEAEIKAKAEAEAREKLESEIKEKAETEAREKLEAELRKKAEEQEKAREEEKAKILANVEEKAPLSGQWLGLDKYDQYK